MFCFNCGNKLSDEAKFCPNCGEQIPGTKVIAPKQPIGSVSTDFADLKKMKIGYIIIAATIVVAALLCLCMKDLVAAVIYSALIALVGCLVGLFLVISAAKAGDALPEEQTQAIIALSKKWKRPMQIMPLIWLAAMLIAWLL